MIKSVENKFYWVSDLYKTCKNLFYKKNYFRPILIKLYLISK